MPLGVDPSSAWNMFIVECRRGNSVIASTMVGVCTSAVSENFIVQNVVA